MQNEDLTLIDVENNLLFKNVNLLCEYFFKV